MKTVMQISFHSGVRILLILTIIELVSSCVSMAPVNSSFESAKTLSKGQFELQGNYSTYSFRDNGESENSTASTEKVNSNLGFRLGYGLSNRFDLKLRYERLDPVLQEDKDQLNGINYFGLSPRYSIVPDHIAAALDLSYYTASVKQEEGGDYAESAFVITPRFIFTYPSTKYFDLTVGTKVDFFTEGAGTYLGLNLGCGLSSDFEKWAVRPEVGIMYDLDELSYGVVWNTLGIALILKINPVKPSSL